MSMAASTELKCLGTRHGLFENTLFVQNPPYNIESLNWLRNNYEPTDNEIFIVTYPKTGTTLTLQIAHQIMECYYNKTKSSDHMYYKQNNGTYTVNEWITMLKSGEPEAFNKFISDTKNSKRFWKTHCKFEYLPFKRFPKKMIICCRNPKDALVSFYHHHKNIDRDEDAYTGSFHTFFTLYVAGLVENNSYFDYYKKYWQFYKDNLLTKETDIYWLNYENLVVNETSKRKEIKKLVEFIGVNDVVNSVEDINNIMERTSVNKMKKQYEGFTIRNFVRKGAVGDWKNYFSTEQNAIIDSLIKVYFNGTDFKYYQDLINKKQYLLKSKL